MKHTVVPNGILDISYPEDGKLRMRKVVSRSNAKHTGKYPSIKMQRMMQWESRHEANAMMLSDADPAVISFTEQPCAIQYVMDGEHKTHYPDLLIETHDHKILVEVKTPEDAAKDEVKARSDLMAASLPHFGYQYQVMLSDELASQPRLSNIKKILRLGRMPLDLISYEQYRLSFARQPIQVWGSFDTAQKRQVARLLLDGHLTISHKAAIQHDTQILNQF